MRIKLTCDGRGILARCPSCKSLRRFLIESQSRKSVYQLVRLIMESEPRCPECVDKLAQPTLLRESAMEIAGGAAMAPSNLISEALCWVKDSMRPMAASNFKPRESAPEIAMRQQEERVDALDEGEAALAPADA